MFGRRVASADNMWDQIMEPLRRKFAVWGGLSVLYYAVYYVLFAKSVGGYFLDVLRHFEFARRWWGT